MSVEVLAVCQSVSQPASQPARTDVRFRWGGNVQRRPAVVKVGVGCAVRGVGLELQAPALGGWVDGWMDGKWVSEWVNAAPGSVREAGRVRACGVLAWSSKRQPWMGWWMDGWLDGWMDGWKVGE